MSIPPDNSVALPRQPASPGRAGHAQNEDVERESQRFFQSILFKKHNIANNVHVVRDGAEALEFIFCTGAYARRSIEQAPKVVLLDLKLPRVDGLEVLRLIKADPRTQHIPVVVLTTSREERDIVESYQLGVNNYIVRPVDFEQFTEAMRTLGMYWLLLNQPPIL